MRWCHDRTEAIGVPFPSLAYERYRKRIVDRLQGSCKKCNATKKKRGGSARLRLHSQLEVITVSLSLCSRGSVISPVHFPMEQVELLAELLGKHP